MRLPGQLKGFLEVRTAQADAAGLMPDEELLTRATSLNRILLTQYADFLTGVAFSGVLFAFQGTRIGSAC